MDFDYLALEDSQSLKVYSDSAQLSVDKFVMSALDWAICTSCEDKEGRAVVWFILSICTDQHIPIHPTFLKPAAKEFLVGYELFRTSNSEL